MSVGRTAPDLLPTIELLGPFKKIFLILGAGELQASHLSCSSAGDVHYMYHPQEVQHLHPLGLYGDRKTHSMT